MIQHINNSSKPLIFLGTNQSLLKYIDVCIENEIEIHGIIDSDYHGNTESIDGISVIDSEEGLINNIDHYRNFNFFCATNWIPESDSVSQRNKEKRFRQIDLLDDLGLDVITIVDSKAKLSSTCQIGRGCFIDCFSLIEPYCVLEDYVNIYAYVGLGHHSRVDRNTVIQRHCSIAGSVHFQENCFLGVAVRALKTKATFSRNTFIHECIYIRRGTVADEVVGLNGSNMSRIYSEDDRQVE